MLWCHVKHSVLFQSFILTLQCLGLPVKWTRCVWGLVYLQQQQALSLRSPVAIFMPSDWRLPGACHGSLQKHNDKNKYIQNKQAAGERGYRKSQACAQARRQKVMSQLSVVQSCKILYFLKNEDTLIHPWIWISVELTHSRWVFASHSCTELRH